MKKIPSVFQRNYDTDRLVRNEVTPGCEWVLAGEGTPTEKLDGTCCLLREGVLYKRYELRRGKIAPVGFEAAQEPDPATGDTPGWLPVGAGPEDQWFREALANVLPGTSGTFELLGPKVQGNPYHLSRHDLFRHGSAHLDVPCDYHSIQEWLSVRQIEGIVWHHPDGRMAKIKRRDFGYAWPI